ncbi:bifunctional diaminohydroxyphosphoribosylaminopyrimidine deaminase/5-amino-6-(5-phosphoribosylamino)uracil reductase RibD [Stygiobacter electus]|uniref:Riboflavin biosynthesis protein RibD n=1 Tax=Stygiobacter electus TaxID=3032292 RepID=A0AAE3NWF7_9BACT|nr:bifunctional diaminohydroxyphosphoribosylaminopyrimidine deaminase/5-amino-6-(5-phosphoribosylamino)uracil reductase RibD [Stygiobacter electus]MDF1612191.1 bifunctional diaminohydroxyphosphoribosylaminopyrimidine deaminase/5-amino-6-(5-phosphoribosylamino)uracil reductase RibD [Stygiobacter electus]
MNNDERYMDLCFKLAIKGAGYVSPNPLVGALIVKDNEIISTGFHEKYGGAHAEANAIKSANTNLKGCTLYCNLEPCVHTNKQTPPCVPLIIESGIKKVVVANLDPNPEVNGKGITKLLENGIEVRYGIMEEKGKYINRFFFKYMKTKLPYVTLKIATSLDGRISLSNTEQTWLTGPQSKVFVHKQRSTYDAILVGANTINVDDPKLTVREIKGRNPIRVILDGNFNANIHSKVFNDKESRTIIIGSANANKEKKEKFREKNIEIIEIEPIKTHYIELINVLRSLSKNNITSLLIEGGGEVFSAFVKNNLADEIMILTAPINLGYGIDIISFNKEDYILHYKEMIGNDLLTIYKKKENDVYWFN